MDRPQIGDFYFVKYYLLFPDNLRAEKRTKTNANLVVRGQVVHVNFEREVVKISFPAIMKTNTAKLSFFSQAEVRKRLYGTQRELKLAEFLEKRNGGMTLAFEHFYIYLLSCFIFIPVSKALAYDKLEKMFLEHAMLTSNGCKFLKEPSPLSGRKLGAQCSLELPETLFENKDSAGKTDLNFRMNE
jgi:hypothetical protein